MNQNESSVLAWHQTRQGGEKLRNLVAGSPLTRLAGLEASQEEFERKALQMKPDILFLELQHGINGTHDLIQRLGRTLPRSFMVVLAGSQAPDDILTAMRLGVREYLTEPMPPQAFNDAVLRLTREVSTAGKPQGRVVSVMGVKGGVGTTSVAVSLAWAISRAVNRQIALVDLDLSTGDLAHMLDQNPQRNMSDVAIDFERVDSVFLDSLLAEITPNLRLLAAPDDPVAAEDITAAHVDRALDHLTDTHSLVIADLASRLDEVSLAALDRSTKVILLMEPTVVCLKATHRLLRLSHRLWQKADKLCLVVNREDSQGAVPRAEIERVLGKKPLAYLPNDTRTIMEAANAGRPAVQDRPKAKWSKSLGKLAEILNAHLDDEAAS
ncbi:MAG: AAA family ATPase [Deltaproteobacteria bacterium]|nr:AAA family ATPase [Deltaproteobacteria bacterium]